MSLLPVPDADAVASSQSLDQHLKKIYATRQQPFSFAEWMEAALYSPQYGYYTGGSTKLGEAGDFITAPELTPLFGRTLAIQIAERLALHGGDILEVGAGTGRLAADILNKLHELKALPSHYYILELSSELQDRQQQALKAALPLACQDKVVWLHALPERFSGVIVGNEVLDAMPVHLVQWNDTSTVERAVCLNEEGAWAWCDQPIASSVLEDAARTLKTRWGLTAGYLSEIGLCAQGWIASIAQCMTENATLLLMDYGFPQAEYYHPQRNTGTLMCHYRHHSHDNPLLYLGIQDITTHVDFTAIAEAGIEAGLPLIGYTSQAQFLLNCGLTEEVQGLDALSASARVLALNAVQKLISPAEMGELFKVICFSPRTEVLPIGFRSGDRCHRL